jgi:hypothetical protein
MGVLSSEWLRQLRRELELRPAEGMAGDASAAAPRACRPAEVVGRRRREAWVPLAARCAAERVRAMAAGKAPEFARVAGQYTLFFDHLALGRATWRLRLELARADRACGRLLQLTEAREAYLDAAEAIAGGDRAGPSAGAEPALEKSPLEIYVDDVERRVGNAPAGTGE